MTRRALTALMVAGLGIAACAPRPYYGYNHQMTDREAWEIVSRDPCRYDEYMHFANKHENPDKRREVVWRLAHEGCSANRRYHDQRAPGYGNGYR